MVDKGNVMMWLVYGLAVIGFGILGYAMFDDAFNGADRLEEECREDCNKLNQEYFKSKQGSWNQDDCICVDNEGKPTTIW